MLHSKLRAAALAVAMTAVALPVLAADAGPVVATVNGKEIRLSAVQEAQQAIPQVRQLPLEMVYDQLLDHVITSQILLEQAKKQKLEDDPAVKAALRDVRDRILAQAFLQKRVESQVSEAAVAKRYEEMMKTMKPREEVKARHILVESEADAKAVLADLKAGTSFEDEAKAKTKDPSGAANGGDLGYIGKGDTVPEFAEAAFKLKAGEMTDTPVKTQFGWHVIKVEDRRMAPPPSIDEARPAIRNELAQQEMQKVIESLVKTAQVKRFNPDGTPRTDKAAK